MTDFTKVQQALERRGYTVRTFAAAAEAAAYLDGAIDGKTVGFGGSMMKFAASIKGLDTDAVQNAAIAGKAMAELAATLPNTGGAVGFFAGNNDMDDFGEQLVPFGDGHQSLFRRGQGA